MGDESESPVSSVPEGKEKKKRKLDEIVFGLSAKNQPMSQIPPRPSSSMVISSTNRAPSKSPVSSSSMGNSKRQTPSPVSKSALKGLGGLTKEQMQQSMFNNPLLSATLSLFNSAASKEFSRLAAAQGAQNSGLGNKRDSQSPRGGKRNGELGISRNGILDAMQVFVNFILFYI